MMIYPAYTIDKIRTELSWRQITELKKEWNNFPPEYFITEQLRGLVAGFGNGAGCLNVKPEDLKISFNTEKKAKKFQYKTAEEAKSALLLNGVMFVEHNKPKRNK